MKKSKFILIINSVWAIPLVFIIRLFNIFKKITIVKIRSDRFGHFAPDGAEQVARYQIKKETIFYVFDWYICNKQWGKMLSLALPVYNWLRPVYFWNEFLPGGKEISKIGTQTGSRDINLLYTKYNVKLPFEKNDENEAISWMKSKGWTQGEKFYCLLIRDNAYLETISNFKEKDWSYHYYRNSELKTYYKAIRWLVDQGVWIFRMGKTVNKPLSIKSSKIIDFPFEKLRSDLLDAWLFSNCDGCISTGTGPDILSGIYDKNILFLNYLPLFYLRSDLKSITYPKRLIWEKNNKEFTVDEYISDKRMRSQQYKTDEIKIVDMTEDEILDATKEFHFKNESLVDETTKIKKKQKEFWDKLLLEHQNSKRKAHNLIHPNSNISTTWLKNLK